MLLISLDQMGVEISPTVQIGAFQICGVMTLSLVPTRPCSHELISGSQQQMLLSRMHRPIKVSIFHSDREESIATIALIRQAVSLSHQGAVTWKASL